MKIIIINNEEYKLIPYGYCRCGCGGRTKIAIESGDGYKKGESKKFISGHNIKLLNKEQTSQWKGGKINNQGYVCIYKPDYHRLVNYKYVLEHIYVVEQVLEKYLPDKAVVHHVNEIRNDNRNENLVVCEDNSYHRFIHQRMRALKACGNVHWRKCKICKQYGDPENMSKRKDGQCTHRECNNERTREYKRKIRLKKKLEKLNEL